MKHSDKKMPDYSWSEYSRDTSSSLDIQEFQRMVLAYYQQNGRALEWRTTTDPYQILVSEIMLQQTQVERVSKKFQTFIHSFPDFAALASAPLADILAVWQGMGYNRRAIALQKCAIRVMTEYQGRLPDDPETLATFPGIGRATASSIAVFAFNIPVVFIETNIRRVFIHFFFPGSDKVGDAEILPLVEQTLYHENPRVWYWALMDLGTSLKNTVTNPNRRSAHYTKQSPFKGSDRYIRGMIIRMILERTAITEKECVALLNDDPVRVKKVLSALVSEGFLCRDNNRFFVCDRA